MSALKIHMFGAFQVIVQDPADKAEKEVQLSRSCQTLLAYLLLNRHRAYPRQLLAGLIWGDSSEEHARNSLNTAIWRLRNALEPSGVRRGAYLITTSHDEVGFNSGSDFWLDVAEFEGAACALNTCPLDAVQAQAVGKIEQALQVYTGDLLDFLYEDWVLREREHLRLRYLDCLACLMAYYRSQGEFARSIVFAQKILDLDPLREEIHRELMRLYTANGQRSLAARQYAVCRQTLQQELGLPPMQETQELYKTFVRDESPTSRSIRSGQATNLPLALAELSKAIQDLERSRQDLKTAMQVVEKFLSTTQI